MERRKWVNLPELTDQENAQWAARTEQLAGKLAPLTQLLQQMGVNKQINDLLIRLRLQGTPLGISIELIEKFPNQNEDFVSPILESDVPEAFGTSTEELIEYALPKGAIPSDSAEFARGIALEVVWGHGPRERQNYIRTQATFGNEEGEKLLQIQRRGKQDQHGRPTINTAIVETPDQVEGIFSRLSPLS